MSPTLRRAIAVVAPAFAAAIAPSSRSLLQQQGSIKKDSHVDKEKGVKHKSSDGVTLGVMSKSGVTRYSKATIETRHSEKFWSPGPGVPENRDSSEVRGAADLIEDVTWGWHHPMGVYNTIPVGAPLIDKDMNIYLGSDDAIRKFSVGGDLLWSYAPRGQLAAAPTLIEVSARREEETNIENSLRPSKEDVSGKSSLVQLRVGERVMVKPGMGKHVNGKEFYRAGDVGEITEIYSSGEEKGKAKIMWQRTGHESVAPPSAMKKRFQLLHGTDRLKAAGNMLVGTTTSGYVFAVDLMTGEEIWATQASEQISGVKGVVSSSGGVVLVATDRCTDRYCYRYRNITNPLAPGNSIVRGLMAADGSALWEYKPSSPVWNFVPQYHASDNTVMFSDIEGNTYCLELSTGKEKWVLEGSMGTYTQAHAVYSPSLNLIYAFGLAPYEEKECNPFPAPGILPVCGTWPGKAGWIRAHNASSGRMSWEVETPEPPSSAAVGVLNSPIGHTRLVVAMGHNCWYKSRSQLWSLDPTTGHLRWWKDGPTLWAGQCAGDKEGGDIRRAMGGRAACYPGAWSTPAIDQRGDIYIGNQVGELQRWGVPNPTETTGGLAVKVISSLSTGVAFQDNAITFAPGMMAVSTCTSLIVFQTPALDSNVTMEPYWSVDHDMSSVVY